MKKGFALGIIVGGLIFGTSIFAATTYYYSANEVSYTPLDTSWKVSTVKSALDDLKSTSGTALTDLKNTNIAKAVSANGSTLSSVISTLSSIANKGDLNKTINPGGSVDIAAGYYSGGKITANANQNSGTYTPSSHGTALDMGVNNTYRYVNTTNVWNQAVAAADARVNTSSTNYQTGYNNGRASAIPTLGSIDELSRSDTRAFNVTPGEYYIWFGNYMQYFTGGTVVFSLGDPTVAIVYATTSQLKNTYGSAAIPRCWHIRFALK